MTTQRIGEVVGNRYELRSMLASGGQGAVYRAVDLKDKDEVAVKVLHETAAADPMFRERMFREAHALTSLRGTAAVAVLDQVWAADGALCLVMEFLHGLDFEQHLARIESSGARMSLEEVAWIFAPIVSTLDLAHSMDILHRDLKPANIFVLDPQFGGGVRLLDFGFAKFTRMPSLTNAGDIAGSPSYIAPETWKGRRDLDRRVDVYALAAILFRSLAGVPPFQAPNLVEMLKIVSTGPRPSLHACRPELSSNVDYWVQQALAIEPDERFMTASACWNALQAALAG